MNQDSTTVSSFGDEWHRFDQSSVSPAELRKIFKDYFSIFPWHKVTARSQGFDMGCGSGRWAQFVAPRVGLLHCIDPSTALDVARQNLRQFPNVAYHSASVSDKPLPPNSQDFGYSLGVLHHVPDTLSAIRSCVSLLKPGAPFLMYLYYDFDNRPPWYRCLWHASNYCRLLIRRLPSSFKQIVTDLIAFSVYLPLSRFALFVESLGLSVESIPLSYYRHSSIYTLRTDSRDRFGTPLEQRFSRRLIAKMCTLSGLENLQFSSTAPYWCVVGYKSAFSPIS